MNRPTAGISLFRRCATCAVAVALAAACAGVEVATGPGGTTITGTRPGSGPTGGGSATRPAAVVGRWTRAILLAADDGSLHESRTTWEFRADGSAIRTVTAWNLSSGFYDTIVTVAQWSTSGAMLTLTYIAPAAGTASFPYRVDGDRLTIGPDEYARVR